MNSPIDVEASPDHTVATVEIPLAGDGTDATSQAALADLREDLLPATVGQLEGVEFAVTGVTATDTDWTEGMKGESLLGFESNGGITPWLPMFLFVILFGSRWTTTCSS